MKALVGATFITALLALPALAANPQCACAKPAPQVREGYVEVEGGRVWYRALGAGEATPLLIVHGGPGATSFAARYAMLLRRRSSYLFQRLTLGRIKRGLPT